MRCITSTEVLLIFDKCSICNSEKMKGPKNRGERIHNVSIKQSLSRGDRERKGR